MQITCRPQLPVQGQGHVYLKVKCTLFCVHSVGWCQWDYHYLCDDKLHHPYFHSIHTSSFILFQNVTKMNRNLKVHLHVAGFECFDQILRLETMWNEKKLKDIPKTPLRQTHMAGLIGLTAIQRRTALDLFEKDGFKAYKSHLL